MTEKAIALLRVMWPSGIPASEYGRAIQLAAAAQGGAEPMVVKVPEPPVAVAEPERTEDPRRGRGGRKPFMLKRITSALNDEWLSAEELAARCGSSPDSVRKLIRRLGAKVDRQHVNGVTQFRMAARQRRVRHDVNADGERLIEMLRTGPAAPAELASALGWSRSRLRAAVHELKAHGAPIRSEHSVAHGPHGNPFLQAVYSLGSEATPKNGVHA